MAFNVDFMANPYEGYEDEETRRKRIEEQRKRMGETEVGKTEVTTYADGSQTRTTTQEVSPQQVAGPVQPRQNLLDYTQRMESGNRPNIGFHYPPNQQGVRTSTAYGPYGITQPQYQEIQKMFPQFRNVPIQQANQQDVGRASFDVFAKQLQNLGVEPSDRNLAAAHLLGAGGLKQYLQTGQLNPQQAQQFGGMEGFEKAVQGRLQLGQAPASGANMRPQPQPQQQQQPSTGILGLPSVGAGAEGTEGELQAQQRLQQYNQNFLANQDNVQNLLKLKDDPSTPSNIQTLASDRAFELMNTERNKQLAEREGKQILQTNDTKKIGNILSSDPEDEKGSYLKLFFLGFVSPESARMEAAKLGLVPTKYSQTTITKEDGTESVVQLKTRADGKVVGGIDMEGNQLSQDMLKKAMVGAGQKLGVVGGTYVNDKTGEVGRVVTDEKTGRSYVQTDKGRKPMEGFRPQSSTGTLADQRTRLVQEMNLKLQGKTAEEQMAIQRAYNQQLVAAGYAPLQPSDTPLMAPQIAGGPVSPTTQQPQVARPAVPGAQPTGTTVAPAGTAVIPGQTPAAMAPRPTGPQLAAQAEGQKKEATEIAEDVAKAKINVGKNSDTADYLLTKINELITHPGFSVSVGATVQPGFQFIPGTDRANWKARFEEIKGQQFLQAFESLKGGGAITDKEGAKAQSAISRMDTSQSEKEFKEAAEDFAGVVQRGIDRQRKKAGLEPLYGTKKESERREAMTGTTSTGTKWKEIK
jgi:hypothetical protein